MTGRRFVLVTHRWLGLGSALILVVVGGTGAVLVLPDGRLRSLAGRFHESLGLGTAGHWLVLAATAAAVLLECGGLVLWWRRRLIRVRRDLGWRRAMVDLHHVTGLAFFVVMLTLAVTGIMMPFVSPDAHPDLRRIVMALHTSGRFPWPINFLYQVCTLGFVVQGVTGVVMWWKPDRRLT